MGHGTTHGNTHSPRGRRVAEAVLRIRLGLQPLDVMHEILDTLAIPSDLSANQVQKIMLRNDGYRCSLRFVDLLQCRLCLLADLLLLDQGCESCRRALFEPICRLVS